MKERKLLVLDLDGTSITSDYRITKELLNLCAELKNHMDICIATGRSVSDGVRYYRQLDLADDMICYNGAYIWNPNSFKIVYCTYMKEGLEILRYLLQNLASLNIENIIASSGNYTYILNDKNKYLCDMMYDEKLPYVYLSDNIVANIPGIHRIILGCNPDVRENITDLMKKLNTDINIYGWKGRNDIVDISMGNVDKWAAVKVIAQNKKINEKNIIAFGDGENDIPILRGAGIGVAMKNASEDVKKSANFVTQYDNDNNGVYEFMNRNRCLFN